MLDPIVVLTLAVPLSIPKIYRAWIFHRIAIEVVKKTDDKNLPTVLIALAHVARANPADLTIHDRKIER